jgi:DNA segregation ATPase FtsK/SpoIIIE-like protein
MDESLEESWVPLAAQIADILEEELSILAGAFKLQESEGLTGLKTGDRIRLSKINSEIMVHTRGKVPQGTILRDNGDGTFDVDWDPLPRLSSYRGDPDDDVSDQDEELVTRCLEIIAQENRASTSMLQRRLKLGYTRAARVMDILESRGVVGPKDGAKDREILVDLNEEGAF